MQTPFAYVHTLILYELISFDFESELSLLNRKMVTAFVHTRYSNIDRVKKEFNIKFDVLNERVSVQVYHTIKLCVYVFFFKFDR